MSTVLLWGTTFLGSEGVPDSPSSAGTGPANGDAMPPSGYLRPLLPRPWFTGDDANTLAVFAGLDDAYEALRVALDGVRDAHHWSTATGSDLDALGALVGVARAYMESDAAYRTRIAATCQHGVGASNAPLMLTALAAAFNVPFDVYDGASAATFTVLALAQPANARAVMPLVRLLKPAGTVPSGYVLVPQTQVVTANKYRSTGVVGTALVGEALVGGPTSYIALPG